MSTIRCPICGHEHEARDLGPLAIGDCPEDDE